jgi:hypothetical protein
MKRFIPFTALLLFVAACEGGTGPGNNGNVAVKFSTGASQRVSSNVLSAGSAVASADQLTLTGSNGTLVIDDIRFIVEEMELRSSDANSVCEDNEHEVDDDLRVSYDGSQGGNDDGNDDEDENHDECEFDGGPFIVDLPLEGNTLTLTTENVPAGTYDRLKFKVDDLEGEHDDEADDSVNTTKLLSDIRTVYPNFPARASMVVHGTQNGQPFTVYFRSKLHVTQAINPPLVVPGNQVVTVNLDPSMWFKNGNQVLNLAALNGRLVDLGTFRNGILRVHRGDDDD